MPSAIVALTAAERLTKKVSLASSSVSPLHGDGDRLGVVVAGRERQRGRAIAGVVAAGAVAVPFAVA